ncbi:hypothetical protein H0H93_002441 [Arthromyces matolae]|nr:hypothetical protein H0H93_002441 [Arthromyces matolae]
MTSSVGSMGQTVLIKAGKRCAVLDWVHSAYVNIEVQGAVPKQTAGRFLELSNDQSYRSMQVFGKWYAWVPRDGIYSLFTVGPNQPELLARVYKEPDVIKLEITAQAVQLGLLEAVVTSTILLHSGRNFG